MKNNTTKITMLEKISSIPKKWAVATAIIIVVIATVGIITINHSVKDTREYIGRAWITGGPEEYHEILTKIYNTEGVKIISLDVNKKSMPVNRDIMWDAYPIDDGSVAPSLGVRFATGAHDPNPLEKYNILYLDEYRNGKIDNMDRMVPMLTLSMVFYPIAIGLIFGWPPVKKKHQ